MNIQVAGICPMGCGETLFIGADHHVTCVAKDCPRPAGADELLNLTTDHHVIFDEHRFTVEHPARERLLGTMATCPLHGYLSSLRRRPPDLKSGRYRATEEGMLNWRFELAP